MSLARFWRNNSLGIVIFGIFIAAIIAMSLTGWQAENNERADHQQPTQNYVEYISSGNFIEGVFENWESEFLQMWALVILTIFLRQKGSVDSKPVRGSGPQDASSRLSIIRASSWRKRGEAVWHALYSHSLGLALLALFIVSFLLHAAGGTQAYNEEARLHGSERVSLIGYIGTSQFWYESFQNWQSEFLAIGSLMVLSIYLRERGSQQSKPVGKRYNQKTGE